MSEFISWNDPDLPTPVRFAPEVLERIRFIAIDGLLSLPRVGVGVGGHLLGIRETAGITVSKFREIKCRHAFGPSFRLTTEELAAVHEIPLEDGLEIVGCYISKTRGGARLGAEDPALVDTLCPEAWQVVFLVEPSSVRPTRGVILAHGDDGRAKGGALLDIPAPELKVPPIQNEHAVGTAATPLPERDINPEPEAEPDFEADPVPEPRKPLLKAPPTDPQRPFVVPERPLFQTTTAVPAAREFPLKWALAAVLLVILSAAAFATRDYWIPGRDLGLRSSDAHGHLIIEWNRKAVRGIPRASLTVNDGSDTKTLTVEGSILHSGSLDYERKTDKVTVRMRAGAADETTTFNSAP